MADDRPFYAPDRASVVPRQPSRGELLFEFLVGHHRLRCELLDHGEFGVEAQFWRNEEFEWSRRFDSRLDLSNPDKHRTLTALSTPGASHVTLAPNVDLHANPIQFNPRQLSIDAGYAICAGREASPEAPALMPTLRELEMNVSRTIEMFRAEFT